MFMQRLANVLDRYFWSCTLFVAVAALPMGVFAQAVVVTLLPASQIVKRGIAPRFVVHAKAIGDPLRIMKFGVRPDLRDNYAVIRVTRNGKAIDVPVAISDPGPTSDSDYVALQPRQSISFEHRGTPLLLSDLPPGEYVAKVKLQPDWRDASTDSNSVSFRVLAK